MSILAKPFFAVPDGEIHPRWFRVGETVTGDVAKAAEEMGLLRPAAKPADKRARKVVKKIETKD